MRQVVNKINSVDFNDLAERKHFGDIYEQFPSLGRAPTSLVRWPEYCRSPRFRESIC